MRINPTVGADSYPLDDSRWIAELASLGHLDGCHQARVVAERFLDVPAATFTPVYVVDYARRSWATLPPGISLARESARVSASIDPGITASTLLLQRKQIQKFRTFQLF
jgi:hypothetical protein